MLPTSKSPGCTKSRSNRSKIAVFVEQRLAFDAVFAAQKQASQTLTHSGLGAPQVRNYDVPSHFREGYPDVACSCPGSLHGTNVTFRYLLVRNGPGDLGALWECLRRLDQRRLGPLLERRDFRSRRLRSTLA